MVADIRLDAGSPSRHPHRDAGRRARYPVDGPDDVGNEPAHRVQRGSLDDRDEVIGAGDPVQVHDGAGGALDTQEPLLHRLRLPGGRFYEDVGLHAAAAPRCCSGHLTPPGQIAARPQRAGVSRNRARVDGNDAARSTKWAPSRSIRVPRAAMWSAASNRAMTWVLARPTLRVSASPRLSSPSLTTRT